MEMQQAKINGKQQKHCSEENTVKQVYNTIFLKRNKKSSCSP
jgi:hypothetical protein